MVLRAFWSSPGFFWVLILGGPCWFDVSRSSSGAHILSAGPMDRDFRAFRSFIVVLVLLLLVSSCFFCFEFVASLFLDPLRDVLKLPN